MRVAPIPDVVTAAASEVYRYGAARVWVFGSLAQGRPEDRYSDVDLATEGLPLASVRVAVAAARRVTGRRVDVVPVETADAPIRWAITRDGVFVERTAVALRAPRAARGVVTMQDRRVGAVVDVVLRERPRSVLDLACGAAGLLQTLATTGAIEILDGVDRSEGAVDAARRRLRRSLAPHEWARIALWVALVTERDPRFRGHDVVTATEVIEHLPDAARAAFEAVLFEFVRPRLAVVTTPNATYNRHFRASRGDGSIRRHAEHVFEWTAEEFGTWATGVGSRWGYAPTIEPLGPTDDRGDAPTQLAAFRRLDAVTP